MTHTATTASSPVVSAPPADQNTVNQSITVSYWNENDRPRYTVVETKTKGRGKVVVVGEAGVDPGRHHQGEKRVHEGVHRIAAVSELDARHGELPSDPPARVDARLAYGWVSYCTIGDSPQSVYGAMRTMWAGVPVLLRSPSSAVGASAGKTGVLTGKPASAFVSSCMDFDGVAAYVDAGRKPRGGSSVSVMVSDAKVHRFMEFDLGKNDPASKYFVREFETQILSMGSVGEFVACARSWTMQRVHLRLGGAVEEVMSLVERLVDWGALGGILASQRLEVMKEGVRLEMGTRNGVLPARYAVQDQVLVQVHGRRRVTLVSPSQAFGHMYPYPTHHPYDTMAMASIETLNPEEWPGTKDTRLERAILAPGDVLFVPAYWFVHVHELEDETICVRVPLSNLKRGSQHARRPPARDATLLRVSRALEDRVAQTVGVSDVKRWLRIISKGSEAKFLDLSTVKGYKCARMTQAVRDDLACSGLSVETALARIIDHRLEATPWLNQNFREPLLLTDTPKVYEDTRTDEERKYPTLFRKKLERDGWTVQKTASTVPIPGVNMPKDADYRLI